MPIDKNREDFRFYKIWADMKQRCSNPKCKKYTLYGGRGISYSDNWFAYDGFKRDMYSSYLKHVEEFGEKQTTLDRIDANCSYSKENCRWATYQEQRMNIRNKEQYLGYNLITHELYEFNNCAEFCRQNNFRRQVVTECVSKDKLHHDSVFIKVTSTKDEALKLLKVKAMSMINKYPQKYGEI